MSDKIYVNETAGWLITIFRGSLEYFIMHHTPVGLVSDVVLVTDRHTASNLARLTDLSGSSTYEILFV